MSTFLHVIPKTDPEVLKDVFFIQIYLLHLIRVSFVIASCPTKPGSSIHISLVQPETNSHKFLILLRPIHLHIIADFTPHNPYPWSLDVPFLKYTLVNLPRIIRYENAEAVGFFRDRINLTIICANTNVNV